MVAKAIKKAVSKNIKRMPTMSFNWPENGSQIGTKINMNEVLEADCFKAGSQVASRVPTGSILKGFGAMWGPFLSVFLTCVW